MQLTQVDEQARDKLVRVLGENSSMFLATAGDDIWNAGAFYAELDPFTLTLVLEAGGTTLRNINANPSVAVVIAPSGPFQPFLQGRATATVRDAEGKEETIAALLRKEPQIKALIEAAPVEAVDLNVSRWRVTDIGEGWLPGRELTAPPA
ncbi:hypothetical protein SacmaDRAFT_2803 [Saccharomonospora marina XMU15]|uniref:Pyridoxamine 5'-phosphate oxidase N-terminal domain-containing protein n=1 Tax=Saccharomonospora marina XMU15 TaxID=882083 RepID=H5X3N0_9PSEU|nr:hypothetical protein [Saccharomonospora marina]EHR51043.1 hypothetical protein SacmaDRAFT_2803 [Saccharomonospora marina XMU15]